MVAKHPQAIICEGAKVADPWAGVVGVSGTLLIERPHVSP